MPAVGSLVSLPHHEPVHHHRILLRYREHLGHIPGARLTPAEAEAGGEARRDY